VRTGQSSLFATPDGLGSGNNYAQGKISPKGGYSQMQNQLGVGKAFNKK
jgi:hypothetical protein